MKMYCVCMEVEYDDGFVHLAIFNNRADAKAYCKKDNRYYIEEYQNGDEMF